MPDITLEAVVARLEVLERQVAALTSRSAFRPGTGDWDAVEKAMLELEDYDFDAQKDQDDCDRKHAGDHLP